MADCKVSGESPVTRAFLTAWWSLPLTPVLFEGQRRVRGLHACCMRVALDREVSPRRKSNAAATLRGSGRTHGLISTDAEGHLTEFDTTHDKKCATNWEQKGASSAWEHAHSRHGQRRKAESVPVRSGTRRRCPLVHFIQHHTGSYSQNH